MDEERPVCPDCGGLLRSFRRVISRKVTVEYACPVCRWKGTDPAVGTTGPVQPADVVRMVLEGMTREQQWATLDEAMGTGIHVLETRWDGWSIQHPLVCRESLLDCIVHQTLSEHDRDHDGGGLPPPGRYRVYLQNNSNPGDGDPSWYALQWEPLPEPVTNG